MKETYLLHARQPVFARKLDKARRIIGDFLARGIPSFVAFSGGKDSTVMLRLVLEQALPPVAFVDSGTEFPETLEFVRRIGEEWCPVDWLKADKTLLEIFRDMSAFGATGGNLYYSTAHITANVLINPMLRYVNEKGLEGQFLGLRKEESPVRGMSLSQHGPVHFRKFDEMWRCCPLMDWTARDVWAFIYSRDLPYNPIYDQDKFLSREEIRVAPWAGTTAKTAGRIAWLKYWHPEIYRRFAAEFPRISTYT